PGPDDITDSDVRHHVLASLQREGIRLAVGDQTIHLVQENKAHREEVRSRELKRRVGAISRIDLFARLSEAEQEDLAHRLVNAPFARGDVLFRQGDVAHWLYIIASGEAEAWWTPPDGGPQRLIETRGPGNVFGELGLMTGAPRRSTVVAITDVEAYRLDKASLEHILRARPELAEGISVILEKRRSRFAALEQGHADGSLDQRNSVRADASALGKKIREFFGL
ncbi:MAG: cyclic nucleotide-binding domain-containing protein, partial [Zoogloea sp.]|nr:cyclic nucleotide-binding domain-containing protein [Zoogloea sp.]